MRRASSVGSMLHPSSPTSSRSTPVPPDAVRIPDLNLTQPRRVHIVGIAGAGMSAIALVIAVTAKFFVFI
jgi:hypothetical protein